MVAFFPPKAGGFARSSVNDWSVREGLSPPFAPHSMPTPASRRDLAPREPCHHPGGAFPGGAGASREAFGLQDRHQGRSQSRLAAAGVEKGSCRGRKLNRRPPGERGSRGLEEFSSRAASQALRPRPSRALPAPERRGGIGRWAASLGLRAYGSKQGRPDRRRRERKPNGFSGNWPRRRSRGVDLRSLQRLGPRGRDAGEVKATGHRGRSEARNYTSGGALLEGGAR